MSEGDLPRFYEQICVALNEPIEDDWSVLRPNLLRAGAELVFGHNPSASEKASLRMLFNTWHNSGTIAVAAAAQSKEWREHHE